MLPEDGRDELEKGDYVKRPGLGAGGLAVQEEVEEFEADGMALVVQAADRND